MFHFGSDALRAPVFGAIFIRPLSVTAALCLAKVFGSGRVVSYDLPFHAVRRTAPPPGFVSIEHVRQNLRILKIGSVRDDGMNELGYSDPAAVGLKHLEPEGL